LSSVSNLRRLDFERPDLDIGDVAFEYRDRSVGRLVLGGVRRAGSTSEHTFVVKELRYGRALWSDVTLSVATRNQILELRFGAPNSVPNATARYIPSNGRAAEWMIDIPNQPFGPLRRSLGLGSAPGEETSRITGVFSWVVPDDSGVSPRGSFHGVMDAWYRPPWKEAATLTGSSGSFAAVIVRAPDGTGLRLERVEVAAALFDLRGSGSITFAEKPEIDFRASGKRTCRELAKHLPPSAYRDAVRAHLGSERDAVSRPEADAVELELRVLLPSAPGERGFRFHLAPGCGLRELTPEADGAD
jgi:hypothetical protein